MMNIRPMTELETARVRIGILERQARSYAQEIALLQAEKRELDLECSDLSAQNSQQAMQIEEAEAELAKLRGHANRMADAINNSSDFDSHDLDAAFDYRAAYPKED